MSERPSPTLKPGWALPDPLCCDTCGQEDCVCPESCEMCGQAECGCCGRCEGFGVLYEEEDGVGVDCPECFGGG